MEQPLLWWSPTLGLITRTEDPEDGEIVYWKVGDGKVSLRHEGLPNELPDDAGPLISGEIDPEAVSYGRDQEVMNLVMKKFLLSKDSVMRAYELDPQFHLDMIFFAKNVATMDKIMAQVLLPLSTRDEVLRLLINSKQLIPPEVDRALHRIETHQQQVEDLKRNATARIPLSYLDRLKLSPKEDD
jgi:hypothetical protein